RTVLTHVQFRHPHGDTDGGERDAPPGDQDVRWARTGRREHGNDGDERINPSQCRCEPSYALPSAGPGDPDAADDEADACRDHGNREHRGEVAGDEDGDELEDEEDDTT